MKRAAFRVSLVVVTIVMVLLALTGLSLAKSLYVIADTNSWPTPIRAYNINPDGTLTFQAEYAVSDVSAAVGLAVDTATDTLFVTSEGSNIINLVDAKTMTGIGTTTAPGAYDLAGIVVDEAKNLIYAVDRYAGGPYYTDRYLYVYKWDRDTKTLTLEQQVTLADVGGQGAFGVALDKTRGLLYVGNYNYGEGFGVMAITDPYTIPYYSTSDWDQAGTLALAGPAIGIAVDGSREMVYSGAGWASYPRLDWCNLQGYTTGGVDLGLYSGAIGIGVDEETGLVYVTTGYEGDELRVYRYNAGATAPTLDLVQNLGTIGGAPTGLAIGAGFNPLSLDKRANASQVFAGNNLTYTLSFDNLNNPSPVRNVVLTDNLPAETTFVSATGNGVYSPGTHSVTWNIGNLAAGAVSRNRKVVVRVSPGTPEGTIIRNSATISSNETPPTTKSLETLVRRPQIFSLAFPVEGYTPYNAPTIAVLDHSCFETEPVQWYVLNGKVKAFNGEEGRRGYGSRQLEGLWEGYMNSSGTDFLLDVLSYTEGQYLYYDGHPGYDYEVPKGTNILATMSGRLVIAKSDPVNGGGWKGYKTFFIKRNVATGEGAVTYFTYYLYVNPTQSILNEINQNGFARVRKGQIVGTVYNNWIHVDFRRGGKGHANIFDPYYENLWAESD
ncbi:MAG: DUF11 domain-containing protein [Deltaproteobacteria bacterium]|nr:MAG: DUF11 domain-containing protein [Deltaproteobacteria bacterium]